jgi:hypothetical protein
MRIRFASTLLSCRSRLHPGSPRSGGASRVTGERGLFFSRARRCNDEQDEGHVSIRANDKREIFFSQRFFSGDRGEKKILEGASGTSPKKLFSERRRGRRAAVFSREKRSADCDVRPFSEGKPPTESEGPLLPPREKLFAGAARRPLAEEKISRPV